MCSVGQNQISGQNLIGPPTSVRQQLEAKLEALKADTAAVEKHLASLPAEFLDSVLADWHKLVGWL